MNDRIKGLISKFSSDLNSVVSELLETPKKEENPQDITIRNIELCLRDFKHAVKHKKRVAERFRSYDLSNKAASIAHTDADKKLQLAEERFRQVCEGIANKSLTIKHVVDDDEIKTN